MTNSGVLLSSAAFRSLSPMAQNEVLASIGFTDVGVAVSQEQPVTSASASPRGDEEGPVEFTVALVRKLTHGLSEKTTTALKVIAQSDGPEFHMKDIIDRTDGADNYMDMRGVWSALTRRTRKIMDDDGVDLIWWIGESIHDKNGDYVDHIGKVSPMTYNSLRTHFGF